MIDGADTQPCGLHPAEARLDDHHPLVPRTHIRGTKRSIVGKQHILPIHPLDPFDRLLIEGQPAPCSTSKIAPIALGSYQFAGTLGMLGGLGIEPRQLLPKPGQERLQMLTLPLGFLKVPADNVAPPPLPFASTRSMEFSTRARSISSEN